MPCASPEAEIRGKGRRRSHRNCSFPTWWNRRRSCSRSRGPGNRERRTLPDTSRTRCPDNISRSSSSAGRNSGRAWAQHRSSAATCPTRLSSTPDQAGRAGKMAKQATASPADGPFPGRPRPGLSRGDPAAGHGTHVLYGLDGKKEGRGAKEGSSWALPYIPSAQQECPGIEVLNLSLRPPKRLDARSMCGRH